LKNNYNRNVYFYKNTDIMNLLNFNKHWNPTYFYNFKTKRIYFKELISDIDKKFINLLIWLRRVWKTTLMLQMINYLIEKEIARDNILYYSFDNEDDIENIINNYLKISNKDISKDNIYIFFDEIQKAENWQNKIKIYYDLYPNIKFILSGSSSLFLKSNESLAWRLTITTIKPLFFEEFLKFKEKHYLMEKPLLYESEIILEFEKYLYRQFFDIIDSNLMEAQKYIKLLKNKIIKEDAKAYFDIKYPDLLVRIFDIISNNPWMIIDYKNMWNDLWIDWRTLQTYIYYLEESFLINKVYNFSKNLLTSEKKQKRVYLNSCSFFLWNWDVTWSLYENYIQNYFDFKYFYRLGKKEVDFISVDDKENIYAIEIKYKNKIKKEDLKWIIFFEKKFKLYKKYIISKTTKAIIDNVNIIPFWELDQLYK